MIQSINLIDLPDHVKNFLGMEESVYKRIQYSKVKGQNFGIKNVGKGENGEIYYSNTTYQIRQVTTHHFLHIIDKEGLSFKNNKLSIWYGKRFNEMDLLPFIKYMGIDDWLDCSSSKMFSFLTKGILEKILQGKITNTTDMLKQYLKVNRMKTASPTLLRKLVEDRGLTKHDFIKHAAVSENIDSYLNAALEKDENKKWKLHLEGSIMNDTIDQLITLGKKANFKWSEKRWYEEHRINTMEIMEMESKFMDDEMVEYSIEFNPPEGWEIIDTKKKCWYEGSHMQHCVFTNYWEIIKDKKYVVFHITRGGEEATLGCNFNGYNNNLIFNQVFSRQNKLVSPDLKNECINWIMKFNTKQDELRTIPR